MVAVLVVVGAGLGMALIVLPALDDLVTTGYGLALLTKVALVIPVIGLGAYNRRRLVPLIDRGGSPPMPRARAAGAGALGRPDRLAELAILLVVVGVTAVLVARSPFTSSAAPSDVVDAPPGAVEVPLSDGAGTVSIAIAPARAGLQRDPRHADRRRRPAARAGRHTGGRADRGRSSGVGPLRPIVHPFGGGEYHVIADIPLPGTWEMSIRVRISDFEAVTATTTLEIAS